MIVWGLCLLFLLHLGIGAGEQSCRLSEKLDLQLIVDSSGSVGEDHFHTMMKKISKSLISHFEIGTDKTRVALFKYSMPEVMSNEFSLNKYSKIEELQLKIEGTKYEPGWTMTAMAMNEALKLFKQNQRKDKETTRVCFVFTDGEASDKDDIPSAAEAWANDGVTVYAVGIGQGISPDGLKAISGADERAFVVENFDAIGKLATSLLKKVCDPVIATATTTTAAATAAATTAATPPPPPLPWRSDGRCGPKFPVKGKPGECNPAGGSPCCSQYGYCGRTENHCKCKTCTDYRPAWRSDGRCGPKFPVNGKPGECNSAGGSPCCSKYGYCGKTKNHCKCETCIDYRLSAWRSDGRCGPKFPVNGKPGKCNPAGGSPCCSKYGYCGKTNNHCKCKSCTDYRVKK